LEWRRNAERSMMMAVRLALLLGLFGTAASAEPWSDTPAWPKAGRLSAQGRVARFHVPADVKLHEQILEVDDKGARHPFDCR
jgi:hypothetical protein